MKLDERILRLIAVGASVSANCHPCLEVNVAQALGSGAEEQEIAAAMAVGKMVRRGAADKMDQFASSLSRVVSELPTDGGCECKQVKSKKSE